MWEEEERTTDILGTRGRNAPLTVNRKAKKWSRAERENFRGLEMERISSGSVFHVMAILIKNDLDKYVPG